MKILFFSYYFPPIKSIASLRVWQWSRHLLPFTDKIGVITTNNRHILAKEERPTEGVEIYEANTFDYRTLVAKRKPNATTVHFEEQKKSSLMMQIFIKLKNTIPFNFFIGEGGLLYIISSVYIGYQLIKKHEIRYIISSFPPYADHYSAWILKLIFRKKISWIADYRDPHIHPLYNWYYGRAFQIKANRFLMSRANLLTTVSEGLKNTLLSYHSSVFVLRNSFNYEILNVKKSEQYTHKFCITYTGSMYAHHNPTLLFAVLQHIFEEKPLWKEKIEIIYAGKDGHIWEQYAKEYNMKAAFINKGNITLEESLLTQRKSHVNLLLTSALPELKGILTGKFYEYLAARRPIIVLINGVQDIELEEIMTATEGGIVVYHQQKEHFYQLKNFILHLVQTWENNPDELPFIATAKLQTFTWTAQAQNFLAHLSQNNGGNV